MRVILVDPTGIAYGAGLAAGLSFLVDLTYVTRKSDVAKENIKCDLKYWFLAPQKGGKAEKLIKGISYLIAYGKIIRYTKKKKVDVIHIQWLSLPMADAFFLNQLKRTGVKLVFTAHNVLPHRNGESFTEIYRKYYSIFDRIIVHGESIKQEFINYFPEYEGKLAIEHHGIYNLLSTEIKEELVDREVLQRVREAKKVGIFFGNMFYNKGTDELVSHWLKEYKGNSDYYLFIVGKLDHRYSELIAMESQIKECDNIFYKPQIIEEAELNTYISLSDIVIMPYRHASMSGIIFKAAGMDKTVITTDTGSIKEYINKDCAFCEDNMDKFFKQMNEIFINVDRVKLADMGKKLGDYIRSEYSWDSIADNTVNEVYESFGGAKM